MHSFLTRLNALVAYMLSVLAAVTFGAFVSTVLHDYTLPAQLSATTVKVKSLPDYVAAGARHDLAHIQFGITVDTSPLFNWNVKQLFIYLAAEYQTENNAFNQVVIWDKIIERGQRTVVDMQTASPKYYFWDDGSGLLGNQNVSLKLYWNVVPNAGCLLLTSARGSQHIDFPSTYTTDKF